MAAGRLESEPQRELFVKTIGIEFHNRRMWNWKDVDQALAFMKRFEMNALVFHQTDMMDFITLPEKYFSEDLLWERWPVRYIDVQVKRAFLQEVTRRCKAQGVAFYPEFKEIWYPEGLLEVYPELKNKDGQICPTNPFWFEFVAEKMDELVRYYPDVAGAIVSPATRESKVSISKMTCDCERCRSTDPNKWYEDFIRAVYKPLEACGKTLVIRDFSYSKDHQNAVIEASMAVSKDIVIGLKNVPHDFWPTFPDNPKLGQTQGLAQWAEFDVWGQYYGQGAFPASLVEDFQNRIRHCRSKGVTGAWFRTDIEWLDESNNMNSFNTLNLIGAAMLSSNPDRDLDEVYDAWLEWGLYSGFTASSETGEPVRPSAPDARERLQAFMRAGSKVMEKALYVRGHVFNYSSQFGQSLSAIYNVMQVWHQREQWDPGSAKHLEPTPENLAVIYAEKREAVEQAEKLKDILDPGTLGLPDAFLVEIEAMLELYVWYARGYELSAHAYFAAQRALQTGERSDAVTALANADALDAFQGELASHLETTVYPHYVYWLTSPTRLHQLAEDVRSKVNSTSEIA
ncbi:hypothetical protein HKM20_04045 [Pelagibacterium halotolerans]|nr:hypothetical protein [Pelagibacterium halotolerans]QJR20490.1 hypothetical protein HKM20_04045 [Pelagibacterium halotolerans]